MKCTESWLREWVNPKATLEVLCSKLTMGGFEVEEVISVLEANYASELAKPFLKDHAIELSITPNRGDCLSVRGVAREVAAITNTTLKPVPIRPVKAILKDKISVKIHDKKACPHYVGRIIRGINNQVATPDWMRARLITAGLKCISFIVDVANYVMLELGQPLHAFDFHKIKKAVNVRMALKNESITLLDGSTQKLNSETLIIADDETPLAIAGVMGGLDSGVTAHTTDIFLESAYFSKEVIAKQRQAYNLHSDAAHRFERGVDPAIQNEAIERATKLILEYAGGKPASIIEVTHKNALPKAKRITLTALNLQNVLGVAISPKEVERIFKLLDFKFKRKKDHWVVDVPTYRFDMGIEEDLIEEVARLYGYDKIPAQPLSAHLQAIKHEDSAKDTYALRQSMIDLGYHEIVSYSFIDKDLQALLEPESRPIALENPITAEMTVMRTSLWPGLLNTMLYNQSRQQTRIRLFEIGACFIQANKKVLQVSKLAGLITGFAADEQWGIAKRVADFFDLKGDVMQLLNKDIDVKPGVHPALHPGQTAIILKNGKEIGVMGALHPAVLSALKIADQSVFVFEIALDALFDPQKVVVSEISKFPEIRRDIAILINQAVPATKIQDTIRDVAGTWLKDVFIFDVYAGKGITPGLRSVALAIILQHPERTLVDEEVAALMERVTSALNEKLGAELRS